MPLSRFLSLAVLLSLSCLLSLAGEAPASAARAPSGVPSIERLSDLRLVHGGQRVIYRVNLDCAVWFLRENSGYAILHDGSGTEAVTLRDGHGLLRVGDRVLLRGSATVARTDGGYELLDVPVADNDGLHAEREASGEVELDAGWHQLRLTWFNASGAPRLALEWSGPGFPRQPVPARRLRPQPAPSAPGSLTFAASPGRFWQAPLNFDFAQATAHGSVPCVEVPAAARGGHTAAEFIGAIDAPRPGRYTFFLHSEDGSLLFIGPPSLSISDGGPAALPEGVSVLPGQTLRASEPFSWVRMQGRAGVVAEGPTGHTLLLRAGNGEAHLHLATIQPWMGTLLPNALISAEGVCRVDLSSDGVPVATTLLVGSPDQISVLDAPPEAWASAPRLSLNEYLRRLGSSSADRAAPVRLRGVVADIRDGSFLLLDSSGELRLRIANTAGLSGGDDDEVLAAAASSGPDLPPRAVCTRRIPEDERARPLTLVEQIHQLGPEELGREPGVVISGVVTCSFPEHRAVTLQDGTRGIYVDLTASGATAHVGDFIQVEGNAIAGEFSPFVRAAAVRVLGSAPLPDPIEAAGEQLIDGSLHCQYVEVEGYVSAVHDDVVSLLMRSGRVKIRLEDAPPDALRRATGAIVRIRGCLFSSWDKRTRRVEVGSVTFDSTSIAFEQDAASDPFGAPRKPAAELLQFDPRQNFFRRICVSGQVLHADDSMLYLADGPDSVRVQLASPANCRAGDTVLASGFARFEGPTPVLTEAVARIEGHALLPKPYTLSAPALLSERFDTHLVSIQSVLTGLARDGATWVLELEAGRMRFRALLQDESEITLPKIGSTVRATGVYVARGANRAAGTPIESFDLLLNAPSDLLVIANPPWWTLRRLLTFLGMLAVGLVLALVWIGLLRRQVAERSARLEIEIAERQRSEQQRALEQERVRLARDLHDELGAGLTEVSMLGALAGAAGTPSDRRQGYLTRLTDKARWLVAALDEIVWAVNPRYDPVDSITGYYALYAQQFLELASVKCRLSIAEHLPENRIGSAARHSLFIAFKEVLTNVVRHSGATEVLLAIRADGGHLIISVADYGRGLVPDAATPGMDGLEGTRGRLAALGGRCEIESRPGEGTTVRFVLPLP